MANGPLHSVLRQLRRIIGPQSGSGLPDAHLLERFVLQRDEAAFEVLVWRHGTMVLNLCRRLLPQEQDAEDAFQATFLALVHKAASISKPEAVGSWLYKVAYRVALDARARTRKHAARQQPVVDLPALDAPDELAWRDLRPVLDEEVNRLPGKYRVPFVLS